MIGTRHGEKKHETLISREELSRAEKVDHFYRIANDNRDLNYAKYTSDGSEQISDAGEYTSNQQLLDIEGIKKLLLELPFIQAQLRGASAEEGLV